MNVFSFPYQFDGCILYCLYVYTYMFMYACIDAHRKGVDEGLMLDPYGYVSTCNSTHFFMIKDKSVLTSTGEYCLHGVTRQNIIDICKSNSIPIYEKNFSLSDVYGSDEAFVTGTFGGVVPIYEIDGLEL